ERRPVPFRRHYQTRRCVLATAFDLPGARSVLARLARREDAKSRWAKSIQERRGANVAAVALAAKPARIVWAMLAKGEAYRAA
ncbi:MAG: hypothetical protein ACREUI_09865, partial [Burkholderiales bacterium]